MAWELPSDTPYTESPLHLLTLIKGNCQDHQSCHHTLGTIFTSSPLSFPLTRHISLVPSDHLPRSPSARLRRTAISPLPPPIIPVGPPRSPSSHGRPHLQLPLIPPSSFYNRSSTEWQPHPLGPLMRSRFSTSLWRTPSPTTSSRRNSTGVLLYAAKSPHVMNPTKIRSRPPSCRSTRPPHCSVTRTASPSRAVSPTEDENVDGARTPTSPTTLNWSFPRTRPRCKGLFSLPTRAVAAVDRGLIR
jgi:hypothetical protein